MNWGFSAGLSPTNSRVRHLHLPNMVMMPSNMSHPGLLECLDAHPSVLWLQKLVHQMKEPFNPIVNKY